MEKILSKVEKIVIEFKEGGGDPPLFAAGPQVEEAPRAGGRDQALEPG